MAETIEEICICSSNSGYAPTDNEFKRIVLNLLCGLTPVPVAMSEDIMASVGDATSTAVAHISAKTKGVVEITPKSPLYNAVRISNDTPEYVRAVVSFEGRVKYPNSTLILKPGEVLDMHYDLDAIIGSVYVDAVDMSSSDDAAELVTGKVRDGGIVRLFFYGK